MSGVKGFSGRKSKFEEDTLMDVVNLSVKTVRQFLQDENIPLEKRVAIAKDFGLRKIPTKINAEFSGEVFMMPVIEKDDKPMEHKVGSKTP